MLNGAVSRNTLSVTDAVAIILGVVIGAGIFKTPSLVAANSGSELTVLLLWLTGGVVSFVGALCYAELTSTYPDTGGDYYYLTRAFGHAPAFLFVWSRMTVIQTGSITMFAFLIGDYASRVCRLGSYSSSFYAGLTIILLTFINIAGIRPGIRIQKVLIIVIMLGLLSVAVAGFVSAAPSVHFNTLSLPSRSSLGMAMIFILLTYGGWNEASFLSAEVREPHRNMIRVLFFSIGIITAVYIVINFVFLFGLGLSDMSGSEAVAADLMRRSLGEKGAVFVSLLIVTAVLSTMNGTIITGARTNYALGRDFALFGFLGHWKQRGSTPVNALLLQGAIALVLVLVGTGTRSGFVTMVEYTAPVFWFFFLLVGISLFVLRRKDTGIFRPFRVPLYPLTPLIFCAFCCYMLRSSLVYTGKGALLGVCVLLAGIPLLLLRGVREKLVK
ncbi:APC family permease [Candidatus Latescibacterota bacterium]